MAGVRPLTAADIPIVADLVWNVLHERKGNAPSGLRTYLDDLFLQNPWRDEGIVSNVYEDSEGTIIGFFGAVPRSMCMQGKIVRLAYGSNFVVAPHNRASMAAIQLAKSFMRGTQDVSITDSANNNSRQLLKSLGFSIVPIYSLLWARPLRPSKYVLHGVSRLKKRKLGAALGTLAGPGLSVMDVLANKLSFSPFQQAQPSTIGEELTTEVMLKCLEEIPGKQLLRPVYDANALNWLLKFVANRSAFGDLRKVLVKDSAGRILGWFIYYAAPGVVGEVLQIGASSASVNQVLDHLFYDAWAHKMIGLHGRMEPQFMQELTMKSCFFLRNGSWTLVNSKNREFVDLLQSGTAYFSRLDGEWSLRVEADRLQPDTQR